jgi:membrane protease subunit HflC
MNGIPVFRLAVVLGILLAVGVGMTCVYTLDETEQAVVTYFGEPLRTVVDPGLHFKGPFFWRVHRFDKRLLEWDGSPDQVPTKDKRYIWVDVFARWRITDPLKFFQSVNNELEAQGRLDDIIDGATRDLITDNNLIEVVRASQRLMEAPEYGIDVEEEAIPEVIMGREKIQALILAKARQLMAAEFGIELVDVQIKRVNYVQEVSEKVYERMISEREQVAALYRAEGEKKAREIEGELSRELKRIDSEAYQKAEKLRGDADGESTKIYADAYQRDPEFYSFLNSLASYRASLSSDTTLVLTTDNDYLRYLQDLSPQR